MARGLVQVKYSQFFNPDAVIKGLERSEARLLSRAGAFVMTRARRSIRKRKRISGAGKPPSSHTGFYKKSILFGYDKKNRSVVIGPSANFGGSEVPSLLEFGGSGVASRDMKIKAGAVRGAGGKFTSGGYTVVKKGAKITYRARPHMAPALEAERENFPTLFTNSIRN